MPKIPEPTHSTLHHIELAVLAREQQDWRPHLGASVLGQKCDRRIQFSFRWAYKEPFPPRILRLFQRGHNAESVFVKLLRQANILVWEVDGDGKQFHFKDGHFGGSADGIIARIPEAMHTLHLLECKTHNDKSFKKLLKEQSIAESHPQHHDQMQVYMDRINLRAGLYIALNKNDDELYIERVKLDRKRAKALGAKAQTIIAEHRLYPPLSTDPTWWECKLCPYHGNCHLQVPLAVNCRTCTHAQANRNGTWTCLAHEHQLDDKAQRKACDDHEPFNR